MTIFTDILFNISILILYTSIFLFRILLVFKFGKNFIKGYTSGKLLKSELTELDQATINLSLLLNVFILFLMTVFVLASLKYLIIISFIFALFLGRYTKKEYIDCLITHYGLPYYVIKWKNKNSIIAKIDYAMIIFGIIIFFISILIKFFV